MNGYYKFLVLGLVLLVGFGINSNRQVFGHTFSGDESASFLATVEMIKIESQLVADQLSNATLAKEHVDHMTEHITANDTKEIKERNERVATELNNTLTDFANTIESGSSSESDVKDKVNNINDVLGDVVSARIDQQQINNVTVKALVVNDLVGEGLQHYGSALGMAEKSETEDSHSENVSSESNSAENGGNESAKIADEADYQSAQAAVSRAIDLYNEIKTNNSTELGQSLTSFKEKIDSKSPFDEIDRTVDDEITPMLNEIFKLNLDEERHGEDGGHTEDDGHEDTESSTQNETHESEAEG